ncbi:hypothetical protein Dimus_035102 [Dionaea muscipula]
MAHSNPNSQTHRSMIVALVISFYPLLVSAQSTVCRTSCGGIPIKYPFGIDDGCGHPSYRRLLVCTEINTLELWTPSGRYLVQSITYTDPHMVVLDPSMWSCHDGPYFRPTRAPFSLDTSTPLRLSHQNEYLFFNCSEDHVLIGPRSIYCDRFPERCDSTCDSASYLCRHIPNCGSALKGGTCCSYFPKATTSLRLILEYCGSYASIYWRKVSAAPPLDQVAEYGIRVDFEIPITMRCLMCGEPAKGGGTCGFDTTTEEFLCLCEQANVTTYCKDHHILKQDEGNAGAIAGAVSGVSVAGAIGVGAGIWYVKKKVMRENSHVTCGVQSNENRIF